MADDDASAADDDASPADDDTDPLVCAPEFVCAVGPAGWEDVGITYGRNIGCHSEVALDVDQPLDVHVVRNDDELWEVCWDSPDEGADLIGFSEGVDWASEEVLHVGACFNYAAAKWGDWALRIEQHFGLADQRLSRIVAVACDGCGEYGAEDCFFEDVFAVVPRCAAGDCVHDFELCEVGCGDDKPLDAPQLP